MLRIDHFTVEHLEEGCVTDSLQPRFSFQLSNDRQGASLQRALLSVGSWHKETTDQSLIPYEGEALQPFHRYEAKLQAWDDQGEEAEVHLTFETGRLSIPWSGKWITDAGYHFVEQTASPKPMLFRKILSPSILSEGKKELQSAKIYATALGIYDLYLDGARLGDQYLAPGFTDYRNNLQYQTYDVTRALQGTADSGDHVLTAVVAGGWAVGRFTYKNRNRIYEDKQAFLMELHLRYTDGTSQVIPTDESWEVSLDGPVREAEFYNGEIFDATVDPASLNFHPVGIANQKHHPAITAALGAPVKRHERLEPVSVHQAPSGERIYDFGQNLAGVIEIEIRGAKAGQRIVFRHAEVLMKGELYTEPLRSAKQEAVYICREGDQTWSPTLTYMGFRYVGVRGIEEQDLTIRVAALYSDVKERGSFHCSDERINRLQENIRWGARSNFVDIPTDCPQRDERMGWTGDIALFAPTACFNFHMDRFLEKWLRDVRTEQRPGGGIPMVVPFTKVYWQWELVITMAVDHWGDACILVPWACYQATGDLGMLRTMYPVMKKYLKACQFWASLFSFGDRRYIWKLLHHYGDWCAPGVDMMTWMRRGKYTATACMAHSAGIVADIAALLGDAQGEEKYRALKEKTSRAYRKILMDKDCLVEQEFQSAYVLPLYYNMLSGEDKKRTAAHLSRMVRQADYHIGTGFPGTPFILFALADNGYVEDAFSMLTNTGCPSWLYEVTTGGTTIWERWDALREDGTCNTGAEDGTGGMVSFNHYASGAVGDFLYRRVAGLDPLEGGYKRFRVAPLVGGGITEATATQETPYGLAAVSWKLQDSRFAIEVTVPMGSICELILPDGTREELVSGRYQREIAYGA